LNTVKYYSALLLFFSSLILFSGCEGDYDITYKFTGLKLEHAENSSHLPLPSSADSIPASTYVLRMNLFPLELSREGRYLDRETPPENSNRPDSILVTSTNNFNSTHPAGQSLNDMFLIFNQNYFVTSSLDEIYITNQYAENYFDHPVPEYADLLLTGIADLPRNHSFNVKLFLHDGTVFEDSTTVIRLY